MQTSQVELSPQRLAIPGGRLPLGTGTPGKPVLLSLQFSILAASRTDHEAEFSPASCLPSFPTSRHGNSLARAAPSAVATWPHPSTRLRLACLRSDSLLSSTEHLWVITSGPSVRVVGYCVTQLLKSGKPKSRWRDLVSSLKFFIYIIQPPLW